MAEMGPTMAAFGETFVKAEAQFAPIHRGISRSISESAVKIWRANKHNPTVAALGKKDGAFMLPIVDLFERSKGIEAGVAAVAEQYGDDAANLMRWYAESSRGAIDRLALVGNEVVAMNADDMAKMGVGNYFPHMVRVTSDQSLDEVQRQIAHRLIDLAAAKGKDMPMSEASLLAGRMMKGQRQGLPFAASADHMRQVEGRLAEKLTKFKDLDIFEKNPFIAMESSLAGIHKKLVWGEAFGMNVDRARDYVRSAAIGEGANAPMIDEMLNVAFGQQSYPTAMRRIASTVTSLQFAVKMPFAAFANASGTMNTALTMGTKNTFNGIRQGLSGEARKDIGRYLDLTSHAYDRYVVNTMDDNFRSMNWVDSLAKGVATGSGFSLAERFNQFGSKVTALAMTRDIMAKHATGRLRGPALELAKRRMASVGLSLDDLAARGYEAGMRPGEVIGGIYRPSELEVVIERAKDLAQSLPTKATVPTGWQHPWVRMATQFKSFAMGQGRLFRDGVLKEAYYGNMEPLALFTFGYPAAGEVLGTAKALVRGEDYRHRDSFGRYIDDVSFVGGMGISFEGMRAMAKGKGLNWALGPTVSDAAGLTEAMLRAGMGEPRAVATFFKRQPAVNAGGRIIELLLGAGGMTRDMMQEYVDLDASIPETWGGEDEPTDDGTPMNLEQLREQLRRQQ
jgi:hypothetical protein